jgi:hypothetical protein
MPTAMDGTPILLQLDLQSPELKGYIAIAMGILGLAYLMYRSSAKRRRDPLESSGSGFSLAQQRSVERQMQSLLVEMAEMARQISAQLDTRAARLEALIGEADERIAALRSAGGSIAAPAEPPASVSPDPTHPAPVDPMHQRIGALADAGRSVGEIARELNYPRGEVELILALRSRGDESGSDQRLAG